MTTTLYSFVNQNGDCFNTTDHEIIIGLFPKRGIVKGKKVILEGIEYKIEGIHFEIMDTIVTSFDEMDMVGKKYPYSIQCILHLLIG